MPSRVTRSARHGRPDRATRRLGVRRAAGRAIRGRTEIGAVGAGAAPWAAGDQAVVTTGIRNKLRFELGGGWKAVVRRVLVRGATGHDVARNGRAREKRINRVVADAAIRPNEPVGVMFREVVRIHE